MRSPSWRDEKVVARKRRRFAWPHVGEDDAALLPGGIGFEQNLILKIASRRLARLLDAAAIHVEHPAMIAAADTAGFDPAIFERRAAMRAGGFGQADTAKLVAEDQQVFRQAADNFRLVGFDLVGKTHGQPISPQGFARPVFLGRRGSSCRFLVHPSVVFSR